MKDNKATALAAIEASPDYVRDATMPPQAQPSCAIVSHGPSPSAAAPSQDATTYGCCGQSDARAKPATFIAQAAPAEYPQRVGVTL